MTTQPPMETLTELKLTDEIKQTVNESYVPNDRPLLMATVDDDGKPNMTWRGSVVAFSDNQLGVWARNADGGTARTLEKHRTYGTGPAYRKLGGRVVYAIDDLQVWANRGAVTSTSDPRGSVLPAKRHTPTPPAHAGRFAR